MAENDVIRRRAQQMAETGKVDILSKQPESVPTSRVQEVRPPAPTSNPAELRLVKCKQCLQERTVPVGETKYLCDVCGTVNDVS